jgi:hypothetical protein
MFADNRYLAWARRHFGTAKFDLAISGMPHVAVEDLDEPRALDDVAAHDRFRAAIARYNDVPPDECIAALGTSHGIWLAYVTLAQPGDDILVEDPGYETLWRVAEGIGARVVKFRREPDEGFALDPKKVADAMTPRTRLVVLSDLHNPGGVPADVDELREVARVAASRGAHVLVDEVYAPFDDLTTNGVWGKTARKLGANVLTTGSLTKCYGLGAHRVGWVLGPKDVIERAAHAMVSCCGHLPTSHAALGALALEKIDLASAVTRAKMAGKRERVAAWMRDRPDLVWSAPSRGIFGFARSRAAGDLTPTIEAGIAAHEVVVSPGSFFGVPNGFRLSWAHSGDALDECLARLARVLPPGP